MSTGLRLYSGQGLTVSKRYQRLPLFEPHVRLEAPELYVAEKGLTDAVNVALALGQPLLVTGDPGTGKTQLAASVACELGTASAADFSREDDIDSQRSLLSVRCARALSRFPLPQGGAERRGLHILRGPGASDSAISPECGRQIDIFPRRCVARDRRDRLC